MSDITYKVCAKCNRVIGKLTLPDILAPFGYVYEHPHNCPMCKKKHGLNF